MEHPREPVPAVGRWLDEDPLALLRRSLARPEVAWSVGTWGAIGEFSHGSGEAGLTIDSDRLQISTARGSLRIAPASEWRAMAISRADSAATREIAFCLPQARAALPLRSGITELAADETGARGGASTAVLFDLAIGASHIEMCVAADARDATLLEALRAGRGHRFIDHPPAMAAVLAASPPRLFRSALARLEVRAAIPPPGGVSPSGPHTHLLPALLREKRAHGPGSPIPEGWLCCLSLYPEQH